MDKTLNKTIKTAILALTFLLVLLAIFVAIKIAEGFNFVDENDYNTITAQGDYEIYAAPDIATVTFRAHSENSDLIKAQAEVEAVVSSATESIKTLGIEEKDIKTSYYNASPRYEYSPKTGERKLTGYEVDQSVMIKIRDLSKTSNVIGALGKAGVSDIGGPNFEIEDKDALMQDARKEAIKEAKEKAKILAEELGVKLGKIVSYNDGNSYRGYEPMYAETKMSYAVANDTQAVAPTLSEGQNLIYSSVSIVYKIK